MPATAISTLGERVPWDSTLPATVSILNIQRTDRPPALSPRNEGFRVIPCELSGGIENSSAERLGEIAVARAVASE